MSIHDLAVQTALDAITQHGAGYVVDSTLADMDAQSLPEFSKARRLSAAEHMRLGNWASWYLRWLRR